MRTAPRARRTSWRLNTTGNFFCRGGRIKRRVGHWRWSVCAQPVRAGVVMGGQLADGGRVALLGSCREPPQLHILNHPLSQRCHVVSLFRGRVAALPGGDLETITGRNEALQRAGKHRPPLNAKSLGHEDEIWRNTVNGIAKGLP